MVNLLNLTNEIGEMVSVIKIVNIPEIVDKFSNTTHIGFWKLHCTEGFHQFLDISQSGMAAAERNCSACPDPGAIEHCIKPQCRVQFHNQCKDELYDAIRFKYQLNQAINATPKRY
jgi:hypothetical protein